MNKPLIIILVAIFSVIFWQSNTVSDYRSLSIGDKVTIKVELVRQESQIVRGLSGRQLLPADQGMLFEMPVKSRWQFWMKDMKFSLDFIWIDGQTVVGLDQNIPYFINDDIARVVPSQPVDKVLEVNAGFIARYNIRIGDEIDLR